MYTKKEKETENLLPKIHTSLNLAVNIKLEYIFKHDDNNNI